MKTINKSRILKTLYHDGSYLIVIWKDKITKFYNFMGIIPFTLG